MNYRFNKTDEGVVTDKKVQSAVARLNDLDARGTLIVEAGYKETHSAYCKITGLKQPINATGKKVGDAVHDAVKKVATLVREERNTAIDKKQQARRNAQKKADEAVEEEGLGY